MNKKIKVLVLIAFTLLIILPPIVHGYIYPNSSGDTAFHLQFFDGLKAGTTKVDYLYLGRYMVGYPIVWVNRLTGISIDALFLWFNFVSLLALGLILYWIISSLVGWQAGLVAMLFLSFGVPSIQTLFSDGAIFDWMTLGIFAPVFIYSGTKTVLTKQWRWAGLAILAFILSISFHSMGVVTATASNVVSEPPFAISSSTSEASYSIGWLLEGVMGMPLVIFMSLAVVGVLVHWRQIKASKEVGLVMVGLGLLAVLLGVGAFSHITKFSYRFAIDLAFVIALFSVVLFGLVMKVDKVLASGLAMIALTACIPVIVGYASYNSAVTPADKAAISYVNSLVGRYYSTSPEIATWVYGRFVNKTYKAGEYPYIYRSKSMVAPNSSFLYQGQILPTDNATTFFYDGVTVGVVP